MGGGAAAKGEEPAAPEEPRSRKEHVFNPQQHLAALRPTPDEVRRLNKLLDTFKKFTKEQAKPTDGSPGSDASAFDLIAEESEITTRFPDDRESEAATAGAEAEAEAETETEGPTTQAPAPVPLHKAQAPSPLDLAELLLLLNATKTEAKRQQPDAPSSTASSTSTASSSSDSSSAASSSATPDAGAASIDDLAASFGGETPEEPSSTPPPSGLYFLVDWNSFLEVGDPDGEKRVNVRIAPKVGDARRFLPVTVP